MELQENEFIDRVVMGPPKTIGSITFIPILSISFGCFKSFGAGFWGNISPIAFITIDENKDVSFYKLAASAEPHDIIDEICRRDNI